MATITLDLGDWTVDYLFMRVHKFQNLSNRCLGFIASRFSFSPSSRTISSTGIPPFTTNPGLIVHQAIYAPQGSAPGPIIWSGSKSGTEQFSFNHAQGHVGYSFFYTPTVINPYIFTVNWTPTGKPLAWDLTVSGANTTPVATTLGESATTGLTTITVDIGDLFGFDIDNDLLMLYFANGGTRGTTTPIVTLAGYAGEPTLNIAANSINNDILPPTGIDGGDIAVDQVTGQAKFVNDPHVMAGQYLFVKIERPPKGVFHSRFRS